MFTRKPESGDTGMPTLSNGGPPQIPNSRAAQPRRTSGAASVIGADLSITGNLESTGELHIEGAVQGDIQAGRIVVGEQANVTGSLVADEIVIRGNVQGLIRGNHVTFQAASRVEGDVYHKSLTIEQGAYFEGKSRRSNDPMSVQRAPGMVPPG